MPLIEIEDIEIVEEEESRLPPNKLRKTPFPWPGGKANAADAVWSAIGDVEHYVEPFAGSLAVLLRRPHPCNRMYYSETVNDLNGLLVNFWRALAANPDGVAEAASWPVSEADLHARHLALLKWEAERELEHLMGDPGFCDVQIAGWWVWGQCCWIGSGWCSGEGPWIVGADGRITRRAKGSKREGVSRKLPHVSDDGRGVNHAGTREEGVGDGGEFHPMAMPELKRWLRFLAARLRHVRILNGDWNRACTSGVLHTLSVRQGGFCGVFLDPPYADTAGRASLYGKQEDFSVAHHVREWALESGKDKRNRIVLACYEGEHGDVLAAAGWREVEWFASGFLKGGYAQQSEKGHQQHRERLWYSPHCLDPANPLPAKARRSR